MHGLQPQVIKMLTDIAMLALPVTDRVKIPKAQSAPRSGEISLSVVVTIYQETHSIREAVERVMLNASGAYLKEFILMASPKSSIETIRVCEGLCSQYPSVKFYIQQEAPGVGHAIREGMERAKGTHVALLAADLETEPEAIDRMVKKIQETGCDAVIGSRWKSGGGFKQYGMFKLVCNWWFQKIFRILFSTKLTDISYGFKILSKKMVDTIDWSGKFHEIYIETTIKPVTAGYRVEEIATLWVARDEGESVNSFFKNFIYVRKAFSVLLRRERITKG